MGRSGNGGGVRQAIGALAKRYTDADVGCESAKTAIKRLRMRVKSQGLEKS